MAESTTDFTLDTAAALAAQEEGAIEGKSPWVLAGRRLRRNYVALSFLGLFVLIVVLCLLAPVYAHHVAHTGPNTGHLGETFTRVAQELHSQYVLGFSPETLDGRVHKLDVRVKKGGMTAQARKSYVAAVGETK